MTLDATSIALLGLFFAALSVVATFLAPRLVGHSRLHFEQGIISRLRHREELGEVKITVTSKGADVGGEIYLASGRLVNSGNNDISVDNFVDPISLNLNGPYELISFDGSADKGVGVEYERDGNSGKLTWRILKPREYISVRFVISSNSEIRRKRYRNLVTPVIRLRDVKSGRALSNRLKLNQFCAVLSIISVLGSIPIALLFFQPVNSLVVTEPGGQFRIRLVDGAIQRCEVENRSVYISRCRKTSTNEVNKWLKFSRVEKVYVGARPLAIFLILFIILSYSAMINFSSDVFFRLLRAMRGRESGWET